LPKKRKKERVSVEGGCKRALYLLQKSAYEKGKKRGFVPARRNPCMARII